MVGRALLYLGAVMLAIMLLIDRPVPMAIAPAEFAQSATANAG
jgi:hypothetical protein